VVICSVVKKKSLDLSTIVEILRSHQGELQKQYAIKEMGVFGSYVRGEEKKRSDVDILVEFESHVQMSLLDFIRLENALRDLLGVRVDLVEKSTLKPRIGKHILEETRYVWREREK